MKANTKFNRLLCLLLTLVMLLGLFPIATVLAAKDTRPAPDRVQSYIAAPGFTATALNPNQAKFTYVEITSNSNSDTDSGRSMKATVKCVTVDAAIAKKIGYNAGNATVNSEDQLSQLKTKLKASKDYYSPSKGTLSFPANSNAIRHQDIGKGTFRYLLSVEAYFNGTYYFDGAGINFETAYQGNGRYTVSVQVCGMTIYPDTASGEGDPPTKLKLVIDNQIGREFTNTNAAPNGYYGIKNYPNMYVANFRWICMPNTNLEIELRNNTVLHVGKYFRSSSSSAEIKTNIHADNLTISGNGVLLASNFNNLPYGATGTAADSAIHANSLTVDSSNVVLDLTRDDSYNCIEVPTPSAFKPINAKSIKLAAASGKWISGLSNDKTSLENAYSAYWDTFTTGVTGEGSSRLSTVTFGRTAGLSDAVLNVGSQKFERTGAVTKGEIQADGNAQALNIKVKAPKWLTTLKNTDRYDYNYTAAVYENSTKLSNTFNLTTGGSSDGTSTVTLTFAGNFNPTAGKSYIVTFSITPKVKATGEKLESAAINGNWLLTAVEKPISNVLSGSIVYTSGVRYGADVTTARTGVVNSIASDKLHYQWQVKSGDAWTDISGATAGKLDASKVNTVVGKDIRLKITADGYEGVLYSPVKTVAKAAQTAIPVTPELDCYLSTAEGGGALVQLTNKKDDQEYLRSFDTPMTDAELAASNDWKDTINNSIAKGYTLYIYTRMKETDTHAAGTIYRYTTVSTADVVDLKNLALAGYTNNTIYVKKGEPLTIDVVGTPANANKWSAVHFIEQDNTAHNFTVKVDNGTTNFIPAGTGTGTFGNHTITITSNTVGRHTLIASSAETYNPYATTFGTWDVVVYEPGNITDFDIIDPPAYADVTLAVGESYAPELTNPTLTTKPAEAMTGHTLKWFVKTPATSTGVPTYSDNNGYISVDANGKVTALAANGTVNDDYKVVALYVVDGSGRLVKSVASYKVTVNPATAPALESISVHPGTLTLKKGDSTNLTAIKNPVNAEGIVTWSSSTGACTVDNTGKVTAVGVGTATITATCGAKTATCTVKVICAEHTYGDTWTELDETNHYRVCTTCGEGMEIVAHSYGEQYTNDADKGQHYHECVCGHKHYEEHTPNIPAATATEGVICSKCNAKLADPLGYTTAKIVYTVTVKQGGNVAPGKQEFELEIFDYNGEPYDGLTVTAKLETNGKGDYDGELLIYGAADQVSALINGGFFVREKDTKAANWTYSDAVWYVDMSGESAAFCPAELQITDNGNYYVYDEADPAEKLIFVNTYTENKTVKPEDPEDPKNPEDPKDPEKPTKPEDSKSPQTGDNSMMGLWIALLFVSGGVVIGTTLYSRKKKTEE